MGHKFFISDFHCFHNNIIKYEPESRKGYIAAETNDMSNLPELERMNEDILSSFDELPKDCEVYILGDVWFCGESHKKWLIDRYGMLRSMVSRMKGKNRKLYLILGNHDTLHFPNESCFDFYYSLGFDKVYDTSIIIEDNVILSHAPVYISPSSNFINIHGHIHSLKLTEDYFCYDYTNYAKQIRSGETPVKTFPDRMIDISKYKNVCWDNGHKIFSLSELQGVK